MLSAVDEYVAENMRVAISEHNCSYTDVVAVIYMHVLVWHACVHIFILNLLISDSTVTWYNCALSLNIRCHRPLYDSVDALGAHILFIASCTWPFKYFQCAIFYLSQF
jgi:hypothetical protein